MNITTKILILLQHKTLKSGSGGKHIFSVVSAPFPELYAGLFPFCLSHIRTILAVLLMGLHILATVC